jgi:hypothetical protein
MSPAFTLIVAALRDKPEGWETIVAENFKCTLPYEWPLLEILAKGFTPSGDGTGDVLASGTLTANKILVGAGVKTAKATSWDVDAGTGSMTYTTSDVEFAMIYLEMDGELSTGFSVNNEGAGGWGVYAAVSGLASTGVYGSNEIINAAGDAGIGVHGVSSIENGVGVRAEAAHADSIAFQIKNVAGLNSNFSSEATADREIIIPDIEGQLLIADPAAIPADSSGAGVQGQMAWDGDFLYICIATDTWRRFDLNIF